MQSSLKGLALTFQAPEAAMGGMGGRRPSAKVGEVMPFVRFAAGSREHAHQPAPRLQLSLKALRVHAIGRGAVPVGAGSAWQARAVVGAEQGRRAAVGHVLDRCHDCRLLLLRRGWRLGRAAEGGRRLRHRNVGRRRRHHELRP